MKPLFILIIWSLIFVGCSTTADEAPVIQQEESPIVANLYFPPSQSAEWATITTSELGWNTENEQELRTFLENNGTKAFIILKDGRIAVEWYLNEHTQNTSWYWASAGKTLTAFTVGLAQENGFLNSDDKTSDYLETGWTALEPDKEALITIKHQLTMTTGLDDQQFDCVTPECLTYVTDAGSRWAYHNGPYTLLQKVVANATETEWSDYFNQSLRDKIGMDGFWFSTDDLNNVYFSSARSMARFGLLNLSNGAWNGETILADTEYLNSMKSTSQNLNRAYGYLWWLNGKSSYRAPASQLEFSGPLVENAPSDMYGGLGKNDQKLYVVPSKGLVVIRMGEDSGEDLLGPSSFDNELWGKINEFIN